MKIKLLRCGICDSWFSPLAHNQHCPSCGAYRMIVNGIARYFNMQTGLEMFNSRPTYHREQALAIARELAQ